MRALLAAKVLFAEVKGGIARFKVEGLVMLTALLTDRVNNSEFIFFQGWLVVE